MSIADPREVAVAALHEMLEASWSTADLDVLIGRELPILPSVDEILAAASLDAAFGSDPAPTIARELFCGFFELAASGHEFVPADRIKQDFGRSVKDNYQGASQFYLNLATTYWTLKIVQRQLFLSNSNDPVFKVLSWLEENVGALFFPSPGLTVPAEVREAAQVDLLKKVGVFGRMESNQPVATMYPALHKPAAGCLSLLGVVLFVAVSVSRFIS